MGDSNDDRRATDADGPIGRARRWFFLDGNRIVVGVGITLLFGAAFGTLRALDVAPFSNAQAIYYLFSGLISGNLTLITVVASINQLLLSRELSSPGQLFSEIRSVSEYRDTVEEAADRLAPVEPLGFLRLLLENVRDEAQKLGGLSAGRTPPDAHEEIDRFVTELTDHVDALDETLRSGDPDVFRVLSVTLTTNYARRIHRIRRIRREHGEAFSEALDDSVDRLVEAFRELDVARQYFKSIYLQTELSFLSRLLFYAGVPAEIAAGAALYTLTAGSGTAVPPAYAPAFLVSMSVVGFLPLGFLCSYVLRITVVTERTAAILPFTTPKQ